MRAPRHITRLLWGVLGVALVAVIWFLFAPAAVGGRTSYVVTDGVSMEPRFHGGDLVLVRSESDYRVGQIVAYHSRQLGTVVLHRIIARDGSRYVFKGDNNNFTDFEHPARSQLIGALWIHVPGAGKALDSIRSPALIAILFAAGTLLVGGAAFAKRRRRRRRERAGPASGAGAAPGAGAWLASATKLSPGPAAAIAACALVAMTPFFLLAVLSFTRPASAVLATRVPYRQTGRLSYSASPAPGPTYPSGAVRTGDPLFTHVVSAVDLAYAYRFASAAPHRVAARGSLRATVSSTSGWQTTVPLSSPTQLRGDSGFLRGRLDLGSLEALISRVESVTAVRGSYTLTIAPRIALSGQLAGAPLHGTFAPASKFSLNRLEMRPVAANGAASEAASAPTSFERSEAGAVTARRSRAAQMALGPLSLSVAAARAIALAGLALVACAALAAAIALRRPRRQEEAAAILSRYGSLVVPVSRVWQQPGVAVIDVADIDALARIAMHYERSILHERTEYGDAFWVSDESGQFRYAVLDPLWETQAEETPREQWAGVDPAEEAWAAEPGPAPVELQGQGWAPAPGAWPAAAAAPAPEVPAASEAAPAPGAEAPGAPAGALAAGHLQEQLPEETLRFGAVSPSALAHG